MSNPRLETFKKLVEKNPESAMARFSLATEFVKSELWTEAIEQINVYLSLQEDEGAVYRLLAECYLKLGDTENAKNSYRIGIEASNKHGHSEMAEEFEEELEFLE